MRWNIYVFLCGVRLDSWDGFRNKNFVRGFRSCCNFNSRETHLVVASGVEKQFIVQGVADTRNQF